MQLVTNTIRKRYHCQVLDIAADIKKEKNTIILFTFSFLFCLALVGSLQFSLTFMLGPAAGYLIDRFGCRVVSIIGGFLYSVGLISASFATTIYVLFPTYSFIFGVSCSLLFTSYNIAAARCFSSHYTARATAFVSCGGAFGFMAITPFVIFLIQNLQWPTTFRILACIGVIICLLSLSFGWIKNDKYDISNEEDNEARTKDTKPRFDLSVCKIPRFFIYLCGSGISMLGYGVGTFFLVSCNTVNN